MPRRSRAAGFTLVEMLVVIGIIVVLISILLPVWHRVWRQAMINVCAKHMSQIGVAINEYAQIYNGYIPPVRADYQDWGNGAKDPKMWYDLLAPYIAGTVVTSAQGTLTNTPYAEQRSVFWGCPEFTLNNTSSIYSSTGYSMNFAPYMPATQINPSSYNDPNATASTNWNWVPNSTATSGNFVNIASVTYQPQRALLGETTGWAGLPNPAGSGPYTQGGYSVPYVTPPLPQSDTVWGDTDFYRHGDPGNNPNSVNNPANELFSTNVLFFDGHVQLVSPWDAWWATMDPRNFGQHHITNP